MAGWKCSICVFIALTLRLLVSHIYQHHSKDPGFVVRCCVDGCPSTYTKYNSYLRHVGRHHGHLFDRQNFTSSEHGEDDTSAATADGQNLHVYENREPNDLIRFDGSNENEHEHDMDVDQPPPVDLETSMNIEDYHEVEKKKAAVYLMNLKEFHKVTETTTELIAEQTNSFVQQKMQQMKMKVFEVLDQSNIDAADYQSIHDVFETEELPFDGLTTKYERNKFIRNAFTVVEPEVISVGQEPCLRRRQQQQHFVVEDVTFFYIPMLESIEQFLQAQKVNDIVFKPTVYAPDGFLHDLVDGEIFQGHELFSVNEEALRIMLYFDDLEVCNPLGKKAGTHKIGVFYYSIANMPFEYRSRLSSIRLLAVIKRKTMTKYGINKVLERINCDLMQLSEGVTMKINGTEKIVRGAAVAFIGDTLASNEFIGFKMGVGFSFQKCRQCECTNDDMQTHFTEQHFPKRTLDRYDQQCRELETAETTGMRNRLSTVYGINYRSSARDFPHFNILTMIPEDIMHVIFEGTALYEIKNTLLCLVESETFSLHQFNNHLENFPYGYKDKECQPTPIPETVFFNDDTSLRQSASSMITFIKILPLILIEKLKCNSENDLITFLQEFCQIVKIVLAPVVSYQTIHGLRILIERHLYNFKRLFPNKTIIPKQHYLLHLPTQIECYGPLSQVWSMRFEGKHQFVKERMRGNNNFKNVVKSITDRSVMYEAALNTADQHPLFSKDLLVGKAKTAADVMHCKREINAFFGSNIDSIKTVHVANWIIYKGQKYISKQCQVSFGEVDGLPEFGTLNNIWITEETSKQQIYLCLQMFETVAYKQDILAYEIRRPLVAQGLEIVKIENTFLNAPLHAYTGRNGKLYICPPFDMTDLIRQKQEHL